MEDLKKKQESKSENIILLEEETDLDEADFSYDEEELNEYFKSFNLFKKEQKKQVRLKRKERREGIMSNLAPPKNSNDVSSLGDRVSSEKEKLTGVLSRSVVSKTIIPVLKRKPEDVSRKNEKGKSTSKDKNYRKDVIDATNSVLKEVAQALKDKGGDPNVRGAQIEKLMIHRTVLVNKHQHYSNTENAQKKLQQDKITEEEYKAFLEQRKLKCTGIEQRMNEINKVIQRIDQIDARAEDEMAQSVSSSMNGLSGIKDDEEREKQAKSLAALLDSNTEPTVTYTISGKKTDDEETIKRKKVESQFKQKVLAGSRDNESLISVLNQVNTTNQSSVVKELLAVHGKNTARMDDLCEKAFAEELKESKKEGDYLRHDSLATKLSGQYHRNCPNGKKYLSATLNASKEEIRKLQKEDLEIDPNKVRNEEDKEKIPKRKEVLKNLTIATVQSITKTPPPPEISKVCTQIYDDYMEKFNDERGALVKVGGHLLLRCVNPELTDAVKNPDPNASDEEKNMKKTTTLLTKVLQNISNQVSFGVKEKHLDDFNELVGTTKEEDDGTNTGKTKKVFKPGPLTEMMQDYFKTVVEEGRKAKKGNVEDKKEEEDESNNNNTTTNTTWTSAKKKEERDQSEMSEEELLKLKQRFGQRRRRENVKIEKSERESLSLEEETVLPPQHLQELEQTVQYGDFNRAHGIMVKLLKLDGSLSEQVVQFWEKVAGIYNKGIQPDQEMCDYMTKLVKQLPEEVASIFVTHVLSYLTK